MSLEQYGLSGIVIAGLCWFVLYIMRGHKAERKEWQERTDRKDTDAQSNIKDNTKVLSELTTLIKSMK